MRLDPSLVKSPDTFALRVEGDSMIEAGILDGDYVLVRPQQSADNGDIVVALLGDEEVTVKRFYREANGFRLQPENARLTPHSYPSSAYLWQGDGSGTSVGALTSRTAGKQPMP